MVMGNGSPSNIGKRHPAVVAQDMRSGSQCQRHKLLQHVAAQPKYTRHQRVNMKRWAKGLMAMHATIDGSLQAMVIASTTGTITRRTVNFETDSGPM